MFMGGFNAALTMQGPRGLLLQDPVIQYFKWNQDALERAAVLCPDPAHRADVALRTVHNSRPKQEDVGCLLEQVCCCSLALTMSLTGISFV